jgi:hypothetical protein
MRPAISSNADAPPFHPPHSTISFRARAPHPRHLPDIILAARPSIIAYAEEAHVIDSGYRFYQLAWRWTAGLRLYMNHRKEANYGSQHDTLQPEGHDGSGNTVF